MMGRHDRNLTIDGEYIHLVAAEGKRFLDMGKNTVAKFVENLSD